MRTLMGVWRWLLIALAIFIAAPALPGAAAARAEVVHITLLQMNDVYEITPVEGGRSGGLARVATVRKELLRKNPRTYTILAGDVFSPSALGTAKVNGKPLAGRQMVAVLNALGLDFATFGNHEFDLPEDLFRERLKESRFRWVSSNTLDAGGRSFDDVPVARVIEVKGPRGSKVRLGLIGLTLPSNPRPYVQYLDPIESARKQVQLLQGRADIILAITHLALSQDEELAAAVPEIHLILGGHEHENMQVWRGRTSTPIFKADANARSVYVHDLWYDTRTRRLRIDSHLRPITDRIPDDPGVGGVVKHWLELGFNGFRDSGFTPEQTVATPGPEPGPLDGLESSVRTGSTALTDLIAQAMMRDVPDADLSLYNAGSIRIDDVLPPGPITQYDVIRILPFGNKILEVEMTGDVLKRVLDQGRANKGLGGFLQTANVTFDPETRRFSIQREPLDPAKTYRVATIDFLMSGREQGLKFLTAQAPGVRLLGEKRDLRFAVIEEMQARWGKMP